MKKFIIAGTFCAVALLAGGQQAFAETTETTTSRAEMMTKIQGLMKLIADLQAKLAEARGEVAQIAKELGVGAEGSEVKEVQEILASDPSLFKVKPTGYFGPLTEEAIKKFQERYGLEVTGKIDEPTREVMRELKMEKKDGKIPPGLVKSDEVKERIKDRLRAKWQNCDFERKFRASVCEKVKDKRDSHDDDDDSDDDDTASSTKTTREEATDAIREAAAAVVDYAEEVDDMEDDSAVTDDELDDAKDTLKDAKKKLVDARRALAKKEYADAVEKAESTIEKINGDDDDDSDDDDEDEDEDDDEDDD